MSAKVIHINEPIHVCPTCGREPKYESDLYCSQECEWIATDKPKLRTRRMAAIIKIAPNGDESFHD